MTNCIKPNDFKPNGIKPSDHLPILRCYNSLRHCTSPFPLQSELVVVDRGGLSESNVVPKSHRGMLFSLGPSGGVRGLSGGVFARGDPVSLSLSQHLNWSGDSAERMWGMISLSSKVSFSSPRDSFGGRLNLSEALILTAGWAEIGRSYGIENQS